MARRVIERIASLLVKARVACFLLLFAAVLSFSLQGQIEIINDSGAYLSLAQSLVSGEGYRDIFLDGSPAHTKYPPVFPLLLAPLVYLFGLNFWVIRLLSVGLGVLALCCHLLLLSSSRRRARRVYYCSVNGGVVWHLVLFTVDLLGNAIHTLCLFSPAMPRTLQRCAPADSGKGLCGSPHGGSCVPDSNHRLGALGGCRGLHRLRRATGRGSVFARETGERAASSRSLAVRRRSYG